MRGELVGPMTKRLSRCCLRRGDPRARFVARGELMRDDRFGAGPAQIEFAELKVW